MGTWTKFSNMIPNTPVCAVSRGSIYTGRRTANLGGFWTHGHSADVAVQGTAAYWDDAAGGSNDGRNMVAFWLQTAGYYTALCGKYLNTYPFGKGDSYIPLGWNAWRCFIDDETIAGHSAHIGPAYFDYYMNIDSATNGPFAGPQSGSTDTWTTTGSNASGRTAATQYSTDRISSQAGKLIDGTTGAMREPFFLAIPTYGVKQSVSAGPAERHKSPFAFTDFGRPLSFNEADISDKPEWLREFAPTTLSGAEQTAMDTERVNKGRSAHAIDEMLRDFVTALTARTTPGVSGTWMDRTLIIVTTEHGNAEGEHRLDKKGLPYECCLTTPMYVHRPSSGSRWNILLIIVDDALKYMWDSMPYLVSLPTSTSDALVSTIDFTPTFLETANAARHVSRAPDGMSFLPLLDGRMTEPQWRQAAISEWTENELFPAVPSWRSIRTHTHRYTELSAHSLATSGAETELYDLVADPDEMVNQTANGAYATVKATLAQQLAVMSAG